MARATHTILVDDLDGSEATTTIDLALDGVSYEIDLNEANAKTLRDDLASWIDHARRVGGRARPGTSTGRSGETKRIREWAQANGHHIGDRGRISQEIRQAYAAATTN